MPIARKPVGNLEGLFTYLQSDVKTQAVDARVASRALQALTDEVRRHTWRSFERTINANGVVVAGPRRSGKAS